MHIFPNSFVFTSNEPTFHICCFVVQYIESKQSILDSLQRRMNTVAISTEQLKIERPSENQKNAG